MRATSKRSRPLTEPPGAPRANLLFSLRYPVPRPLVSATLARLTRNTWFSMPERPSHNGPHARARGSRRAGRPLEADARRARPRKPGWKRAVPSEGERRDAEAASSAASGPPTATIKLQKHLADAGLGSRRAMEELIQAGQVNVNGRLAKLGARVSANDRITVGGKLVERRPGSLKARLPRIVLYHKPEGEIVSRSDPEGRPSVFDRVPLVKRGRWLAVGRLDFNTCGLLIFTDSGELANRLTHPRFQARRDYAVRIVGELTPEQVHVLRTGVALEDGPARFELLEPQGGEGTNRWYRVRVREGRNRLVRRLFAALGLTVSRLMRTGFGPFDLPPRVKRGQWLRLDPDETKQALLQLEPTKPPRPRGSATRRRLSEQISASREPARAERGEEAAPRHRRRRFPAR